MDDTKIDSLRNVVGRCVLVVVLLQLAGCAGEPDSRRIRLEGQRAMVKGNFRVARGLFRQAHEMVPEDPANLHDLGDCCMYFSRDQFARQNVPAAMREVDQAVAYYQRAIDASPGFQAALLGKNLALELKGQFEAAVAVAEWAAEFVGPSARQQMFLASEMEERGDLDAALLRLRQAVAMEPDNAAAHESIGGLYLRSGKPELALRHLNRANRLDPGRPDTLALLEELGASPPPAHQQPSP